jgi:hypothetical protein
MDPERFKRKTKETKAGRRCRKHPGYAVTGQPQSTKAYVNGCPVCWELFNTKEEEPEAVEVSVVEDDNGNSNVETQFKPGPEHPNWKKKVEPDDPIHEMVRKYTKGGETIIAEICKIAGVHPTHTLNFKNVANRDKFQALKWLRENRDPPAVEEGSGGNLVVLLNLGDGSFTEYTKQIQQELKLIPGG